MLFHKLSMSAKQNCWAGDNKVQSREVLVFLPQGQPHLGTETVPPHMTRAAENYKIVVAVSPTLCYRKKVMNK